MINVKTNPIESMLSICYIPDGTLEVEYSEHDANRAKVQLLEEDGIYKFKVTELRKGGVETGRVKEITIDDRFVVRVIGDKSINEELNNEVADTLVENRNTYLAGKKDSDINEVIFDMVCDLLTDKFCQGYVKSDGNFKSTSIKEEEGKPTRYFDGSLTSWILPESMDISCSWCNSNIIHIARVDREDGDIDLELTEYEFSKRAKFGEFTKSAKTGRGETITVKGDYPFKKALFYGIVKLMARHSEGYFNRLADEIMKEKSECSVNEIIYSVVSGIIKDHHSRL